MRCVNLCIYFCPGANVDNGRVNNNVQRAQVWNKCGIQFLIKHQQNTSDDSHFQYVDREIEYGGGDPINAPTKLRRMFSFRPKCDPEDVAIYYVNGNTFQSGATGGSYFGEHPELVPRKQYSIILTNDADFNVLAHELGHLLFTRFEGGNVINDDPDPNQDPNDRGHNTNPCNLMFPAIRSTDITEPQCELANRSELAKECPPPPAPSEGSRARRIEIIGNMYILDDEEFPDTDESTNIPLGSDTNPRVILLGPSKTFDILTWTEKFGGEIRVEARFYLSLRQDLSVDVLYDVMLFEGTSEDTGDLDGRKLTTTPINILKDQTGTVTVEVKNEDEGDDDRTKINLTIKNKRQ